MSRQQHSMGPQPYRLPSRTISSLNQTMSAPGVMPVSHAGPLTLYLQESRVGPISSRIWQMWHTTSANPETIVCSYLPGFLPLTLSTAFFLKNPDAARTVSHAGVPEPTGVIGDTMAVFKFTVLIMLPNPEMFDGLNEDCGWPN